MVPTAFSTENFAPSDRASAWHRWLWPVFDVGPSVVPDDRLLARNEVWDLGDLLVSRVVASPSTTVRRRANLAKAPVDHWVLSCCRKGATSVRTERAFLEARPNVPFLWSLGEPSRIEWTNVDKVQLLLPRDMFPEIRTQLDALRGSVLNGPSAAVLGEYIGGLARWLPRISAEAVPLVAASVHNMISACVAPSADTLRRAETDLNCFQLDRVRRAVQAHLRSPSLGPEALCKMVGMSRSSLYRLFLNSGGIMHYIQRQRLLRAHAILSDPLSRQTVVAVSEDLCFSDASSFSRAFRRQFGCSPSDVRAAATGGNPPPPFSRPREHGDTHSFANFLRV